MNKKFAAKNQYLSSKCVVLFLVKTRDAVTHCVIKIKHFSIPCNTVKQQINLNYF